ncbi:hypothetical protein RAS1_41320 [Phycisphaerae bacterium RAS1]|nr:hypothetical protein RAS1_41320 [Phycisphaerae bacterium RAS1]
MRYRIGLGLMIATVVMLGCPGGGEDTTGDALNGFGPAMNENSDQGSLNGNGGAEPIGDGTLDISDTRVVELSGPIRDTETIVTGDTPRAVVVTFKEAGKDSVVYFVFGPNSSGTIERSTGTLNLLTGWVYWRGHWGRVRGKRVMAGAVGSELVFKIPEDEPDTDEVFFVSGTMAFVEGKGLGRFEWDDTDRFFIASDAGLSPLSLAIDDDGSLDGFLREVRDTAAQFGLD